MLKSVTKFILIIEVWWIEMTASTINWSLQSSNVVFGGNILLFCNTTLSERLCKKCTERWYGGKYLDILTFNGLSNNKEKYETIQSNDGFGLVIKDLSISDIDVPYKCSFGFDSYKDVLRLPDKFELQPSKDTISTNYDKDVSTVNLQVELKLVYPLPTCTVLLDGINISEHLETNVEKKGLFYRVVMQIKYTTSSDICISSLQMECEIGTRNASLINAEIGSSCEAVSENDTDITKLSTSKIWIIISITAVVLISISLMIIRIKQMKKKTTQECSNFDGIDDFHHKRQTYVNESADIVEIRDMIIDREKGNKSPTVNIDCIL